MEWTNGRSPTTHVSRFTASEIPGGVPPSVRPEPVGRRRVVGRLHLRERPRIPTTRRFGLPQGRRGGRPQPAQAALPRAVPALPERVTAGNGLRVDPAGENRRADAGSIEIFARRPRETGGSQTRPTGGRPMTAHQESWSRDREGAVDRSLAV